MDAEAEAWTNCRYSDSGMIDFVGMNLQELLESFWSHKYVGLKKTNTQIKVRRFRPWRQELGAKQISIFSH
jgi:hypothetical protein